jgi:hypothetical protein
VAGDGLDDSPLGRDSLQLASDALRNFGAIPVLLLPGNHDAATADSALRRLELGPNAYLLKPLLAGGAERAAIDRFPSLGLDLLALYSDGQMLFLAHMISKMNEKSVLAPRLGCQSMDLPK